MVGSSSRVSDSGLHITLAMKYIKIFQHIQVKSLEVRISKYDYVDTNIALVPKPGKYTIHIYTIVMIHEGGMVGLRLLRSNGAKQLGAWGRCKE